MARAFPGKAFAKIACSAAPLLVAALAVVCLDLKEASTYSPTTLAPITHHFEDINSSSDYFEKFIACQYALNGTRSMTTVNVSIPEFWDRGCSHPTETETVFFHVGKGGGGTFEFLFSAYRIGHQTSHPFPFPKHIRLLQTGQFKNLVINVRDPADRFVSAFNWRLIVLCRPDDERVKGNVAARDPLHHCNINTEEEAMLREIYNSSANLMAEALCEESPSYTAAKEHVLGIGHANVKLVDWLQFLIDPSQLMQVTDGGISKFLAVPMEKQPGNTSSLFQQHIGQLVMEIIRDKYGKELAQEIMKHKPTERNTSNEVGGEYQHSSVLFNNKTKSAPLTQLGECCVTRHYEDDYRLIRTMLPEAIAADTTIRNIKPLPEVHAILRTACLWGDDEQQKLCLADLRSMLARRAMFLDRSRGTCSEIVSSNVSLANISQYIGDNQS